MTAVPPWRRVAEVRAATDEMAVLDALSGQELGGYELMRVTGLRPGRMYPALHRLTEAKLITDRWTVESGSRRRLYTAARP